jgi:hypothetical protein
MTYSNKEANNISLMINYLMFIQRIKMVKQWAGWLRWMKTVFERSKTSEIWKNMELEKWFDPAFQEFVNRELSHTCN